MKKISILVALLLIGIVATATAVVAFGPGSETFEQHREDIQSALAAGDYSAWRTAMDELHDEMVTEEAFEDAEKRYEERGELGMGPRGGGGMGRGLHGGMGAGMGRGGPDEETRAALDEALENKDYDAWITLHENLGQGSRFSELTEEDFLVMAEMHVARQAGDVELAKELVEQLDLPGPRNGMGSGMGRGLHGGMGAGMGGQGLGDCPYATE